MRTTLLISLSAVVLVFACYGLWKYTHPTSAPLDTALLEEHADQYADLAQVVSNQIVGLWQSSDDAKFKREFLSNGTSVDYYDGTVSSKDTWKAFTSEHPVATYSPLEPNTPYLQMLTDDNVALTFTVTKLTPEVLELVYLDRGGMLSFTKVTNK
ncbi:MAG: hypothetical protein KBC21_04490 [Candidatus Pacebacteria bacterium]|nr:hypothetical protein [Candidatus Paceibacterota bacterium]